MAVYTTLERSEIEALVARFGLGDLMDYEGVASGIENTNYFLTINRNDAADDSRGRHPADFVLTLFETQAAQDLAFHIDLLQLLARKGLPVPAPMRDIDGVALQSLLGKPTLLIPRVRGVHPRCPRPAQCRAIGTALAAIHNVAEDAGLQHQSHRGLAWLRQAAARVRAHLATDELDLLDRQLAELTELERLPSPLPQGIIHGDLFRDNALFEQDSLTGIIDFFSAGTGFLLLDLAIAVNDWCYDPSIGLVEERLTPLLDGYQEKRALTATERECWPALLRLAALRFWISRLEARHVPEQQARPGALVAPRDPAQYLAALRWHLHHPQQWPRSP